MDEYALPQEWACALHGAGYDGIIHGLRHLPSAIGASLFGDAGAQPSDVRFASVASRELDETVRVDFARATAILVEGTPTPLFGLNVLR